MAPGAFVQWQEDFEEQAKERMLGDCVFTGDVTDMPKASVAISNCDGLVSNGSPTLGIISVCSFAKSAYRVSAFLCVNTCAAFIKDKTSNQYHHTSPDDWLH